MSDDVCKDESEDGKIASEEDARNERDGVEKDHGKGADLGECAVCVCVV